MVITAPINLMIRIRVPITTSLITLLMKLHRAAALAMSMRITIITKAITLITPITAIMVTIVNIMVNITVVAVVTLETAMAITATSATLVMVAMAVIAAMEVSVTVVEAAMTTDLFMFMEESDTAMGQEATSVIMVTIVAPCITTIAHQAIYKSSLNLSPISLTTTVAMEARDTAKATTEQVERRRIEKPKLCKKVVSRLK